MATFLATPTCPIATLPTTPKVSLPTCQQKSFSTNGGPFFFGLKHIPKIQLPKAANISSTRSRCFRTTISCSAEPETLKVVQSTIANQLSIEVSTVTPETKFADLGADSLDTVEIMMALEEQFDVSIGEKGAENIVTVQDAADLIQKVQAASA
ncbi:acyl carrier protein, chloroplastic isoform X2 [Ricinus communis]|uniref:acyl carrier protein, chloroplastic isoform X2 n=1 Tax=Ricinus communis TaxID=3988 RepID=UPI00077273E7|nr:acyl carrier protein, chloroplastic isoform X2 [Ricinus communis]|eukprot:XP_002516171.2 acyl carrier protein, chloroplastic isoform X2 [Ricinus communis]